MNKINPICKCGEGKLECFSLACTIGDDSNCSKETVKWKCNCYCHEPTTMIGGAEFYMFEEKEDKVGNWREYELDNQYETL